MHLHLSEQSCHPLYIMKAGKELIHLFFCSHWPYSCLSSFKNNNNQPEIQQFPQTTTTSLAAVKELPILGPASKLLFPTPCLIYYLLM